MGRGLSNIVAESPFLKSAELQNIFIRRKTMKRMKTLPMISLWILSLLALSFIGCESDSWRNNLIPGESAYPLNKRAKGAGSDQIEYVPIVSPESKRLFRGKKLENLTQEERNELEQELRKAGQAQLAIQAIVLHQPQWQIADKKIKSILQSAEKSPPLILNTLEQFAGSVMLRRLLAESDSSQENREAIDFYTKMLLRNHHPDSDLISQALTTLEGYWPGEKIARYALETANNARTYLKENPCQPCLESTGIKEQLLDARQRKLLKMQQALSALEKKAKRESGS
jgi:hypothetical protein